MRNMWDLCDILGVLLWIQIYSNKKFLKKRRISYCNTGRVDEVLHSMNSFVLIKVHRFSKRQVLFLIISTVYGVTQFLILRTWFKKCIVRQFCKIHGLYFHTLMDGIACIHRLCGMHTYHILMPRGPHWTK